MAELKQNHGDCATELWIDGKFQASWHWIEIPDKSKAIIESMIEHAVEHGKELKGIEIRKAILG